MGQNFDFGDQIGNLLQNLMMAWQRKSETTAEEARQLMQMENLKKQHKEVLDEEKNRNRMTNDREVSANRATAINQAHDNFIREGEALAFLSPANQRKLKKAGTVSGTEISSAYGDAYGSIIPEGNYFSRSVFLTLKMQEDNERAQAKLDAQQPVNITGLEKIPQVNDQNIHVPPQKIVLPVEGGSGDTIWQKFLRATHLEGLAFKEDLTMQHLAKTAPALGGVGKITGLDWNSNSNSVVINTAGSDYNADFLDKKEVDKWIVEDLPTVIKQLGTMRPQDENLNAERLLGLGKLTLNIARKHPEYRKALAPTMPWVEKYIDFINQKEEDRNLKREGMEIQNQLKMINMTMNKSADPAIQEAGQQLFNRLLGPPPTK